MDTLLERAEQVTQHFYSEKTRLELLADNIKGQENAEAKMEADHAECLKFIEELGLSTAVMKKAIGILSERGMKSLQELLTYGLQTIYTDKNYEVEIEISERANAKTAEFFLWCDTADHTRIRCKLRDSVGGGIQTTVALILRVYFIIHLGLRRVLFFDESLTQVSAEYHEGLFTFLKKVEQDLGFDILSITHSSEFIEFADKMYRMKDGVLRELSK